MGRIQTITKTHLLKQRTPNLWIETRSSWRLVKIAWEMHACPAHANSLLQVAIG